MTTATDHTNLVLQRYKYVEMREGGSGRLFAYFHDVVSKPHNVMASGGFVMSSSHGPISHDEISLDRKLQQLRGLDGIDQIALARWEKVLEHMKRREAVRAIREAKRKGEPAALLAA